MVTSGTFKLFKSGVEPREDIYEDRQQDSIDRAKIKTTKQSDNISHIMPPAPDNRSTLLVAAYRPLHLCAENDLLFLSY